MPCTLLLILQWVIHKGSGTLTHFWLGGNCCDLSTFLGGSQNWHIRSGCCSRLFCPQWPLAGLPPSAIYSHTFAAFAGWIGLPLGSDDYLCFASSPHFHPGSRGMPQIINTSSPPVPAAKRPQFMKVILETRCACAFRKCQFLYVYVVAGVKFQVFRSSRSDHVCAWAPRVWVVHRSPWEKWGWEDQTHTLSKTLWENSNVHLTFHLTNMNPKNNCRMDDLALYFFCVYF